MVRRLRSSRLWPFDDFRDFYNRSRYYAAMVVLSVVMVGAFLYFVAEDFWTGTSRDFVPATE